MARAGLSTAAVVDTALAVIDERGMEGLTLGEVAARAGVAPPSLYKHVNGLAELRTRASVRVMAEMADQLARAVMGRAGDDAVATLMRTFREYVRRHPRRYAAVPPDPLRDPVMRPTATKLLEVFLSVLRAYRLDESAAVHAARCLRAIVHGFTSIEAAGGFGLPEDLDETFEQLIAMYVASLPR
ncbi:MAG TPA: WHG domain-containing protein [Natronosporangium sp.]|nr:WHG domain-containing protein [Natronosporangium sp.]